MLWRRFLWHHDKSSSSAIGVVCSGYPFFFFFWCFYFIICFITVPYLLSCNSPTDSSTSSTQLPFFLVLQEASQPGFFILISPCSECSSPRALWPPCHRHCGRFSCWPPFSLALPSNQQVSVFHFFSIPLFHYFSYRCCRCAF